MLKAKITIVESSFISWKSGKIQRDRTVNWFPTEFRIRKLNVTRYDLPVAIDPRSILVMKSIRCRVCLAAHEKCFHSVRYPWLRLTWNALLRIDVISCKCCTLKCNYQASKVSCSKNQTQKQTKKQNRHGSFGSRSKSSFFRATLFPSFFFLVSLNSFYFFFLFFKFLFVKTFFCFNFFFFFAQNNSNDHFFFRARWLSIRNLNKFVAPKIHSKITMCSAIVTTIWYSFAVNSIIQSWMYKVRCVLFNFFLLISRFHQRFFYSLFFFRLLFSFKFALVSLNALSFFFAFSSSYSSSFFAQLKHFEWNGKNWHTPQ